MDRRDFLKTTGAAAVAAGAAASAKPAESEPAGIGEQAAPSVLRGGKRLTLLCDFGPDLPGLGPDRLARRIEVATDGRFRIVRVEAAEHGAPPDLTFGHATRHARLHPAFAFFAGLPLGQGLEAGHQHAWLAAGGGEMLWEELAADFGFKPLLAGHTGASTGIWASARLERASDLAGAKLHAVGLAADTLRALGAVPVELAPCELKPALAEGRIRGAEWLGPLPAVSPDLQPLGRRVYEPGFHPGGLMLSLSFSRRLWEAIGASDRAIFEACAAQEHQASLGDALVHAAIAGQVQASARGPARIDLSDDLADALELALADVIEGIADDGPEARRIHDSYQAFRRLLGEDVIV
jgi:TRAP-type mannitol/chloroaromatic compound transport system substrate-binding protein